MYHEDQLRSMTPQERLEVKRALAAIDQQALGNRAADRRRAIVLIVVAVCCLVLAAWIGVLAATLPRYYRSGGWRGAGTVTFDAAGRVTAAAVQVRPIGVIRLPR